MKVISLRRAMIYIPIATSLVMAIVYILQYGTHNVQEDLRLKQIPVLRNDHTQIYSEFEKQLQKRDNLEFKKPASLIKSLGLDKMPTNISSSLPVIRRWDERTRDKGDLRLKQIPVLRHDQTQIYSEFEKQLQKLDNLEFKNSASLIQSLGLDKMPTNISSSLPVLVTGSNTECFMASQGLIKSIHTVLMPKYPNLKLIYYDLGLTADQALLLRKYCRCEVRSFPFEKLPSFVKKLKCYAFKSVAVQMVFQEFGNVWWLDSSIRFLTANLDQELKRLQRDNVLFFNAGDGLHSFVQRTHPQTFEYFKEDPWKFVNFTEFIGTLVAFRNSHLTRVVLRQWLACSLDKGCIDPPGANKNCVFVRHTNITNADIGRCHRYDQSILNLALRPLFHNQNLYPLPKYIAIQRRKAVEYFPRQ